MNNESNGKSIYDVVITLAILALIITWCLMIIMPFVSIILWSLILALAFSPMHKKLSGWIGGRKKLASVIIVTLGLAIILVPSGMFLDSLITSVKDLKSHFDAGTLTIPPPTEDVKAWPVIGEKVYSLWNEASINIGNTIFKYRDHLVGFGGKLAQGILSAFGSGIQMMVALIIAGFLLAIEGVGGALRKFFRKAAGTKGDEYADLVYKTVGNVVNGILGVAFIQAFLIGFGFLLAGVPLAGLWTLIVFFLAVLQIPPAIVVYPIIIYLYTILPTGQAIGWTIFLLVAGVSDNILKPILLAQGAPVPMLIIFIGVIGGFILSGLIGLFTGAIVLSLGYRLFLVWLNSGQPVDC